VWDKSRIQPACATDTLKLGKLFFYKDAGMKKIVAISFIVIFLTTLTGGLVSCNSGANTQLPSTEITEYQGQNLSAITDDRDVSIKGAQHIDISTYQLDITGLVENPVSVTYDEVVNDYQSYKKVVELNCVEGWSATILWEGVQLKDLLAAAIPTTEAKVVIFEAYDGYTTSFPIEYILDNQIIMAYKMNGLTIPDAQGYPFVLVAESKWGYKWIKWITKIELSDDTSYRGFWEQRGYSNSGDLGMSFLGP
jgi:DMSO/TMAO reductase YedYZ molybdopterin-dependent catalytic subunit